MPIVLKCGSLNLLGPSGPVQACKWDCFLPLLFIYLIIYLFIYLQIFPAFKKLFLLPFLLVRFLTFPLRLVLNIISLPLLSFYSLINSYCSLPIHFHPTDPSVSSSLLTYLLFLLSSFLHSLSDKWRRYTRLDVEKKGGATHARFILLRPQISNNNKANFKTMRTAN